MIIPVIHFDGNCDEAISFYKEVLGAEVKEIAYFKDAPDTSWVEEPLPPNFVMHSEILVLGTVLNMTDGGEKKPSGENFSFMITKETDDEVTVLYNKLLDGGKVIEPLGATFYASMYGMVEDKFGVAWQVITSK